MRQEGLERHPPDGRRPLEAEVVPATQHDPRIEGEGRTDRVRQFLAGRLAQAGKLGRERLEGRVPQLLGLLFFVTIMPIGLVMRAFGKDFLRLKLDRNAKTYWIERAPPGPPPQSMRNQF